MLAAIADGEPGRRANRGGKLARLISASYPMTQQYIVGEFSSLLARLQPAQGQRLVDAVTGLRREVESSPVQRLPELAQDALDLADVICWCALDEGDAYGFCERVGAEVALRDFMLAAGLLRSGGG